VTVPVSEDVTCPNALTLVNATKLISANALTILRFIVGFLLGVEKGKKKLKPVCASCSSCIAMLSLRFSFYHYVSFYLCLIAWVE
jgi:hypothetical protein